VASWVILQTGCIFQLVRNIIRMKKMDDKNRYINEYIYRIDSQDRIFFVSENWQHFAEENKGADSCGVSHVLNQPLWHFITGEETEYLFRLILEKVRTYGKWVNIPIRCDSPVLRRFLEISIGPLSEKSVEFRSRVIRVESRPPIMLFETDVPRSSEMVRVCSFCKKIAVSENTWEEVEDALNHMALLCLPRLPMITHGMCRTCFQDAMAELESA